MNDKPSHTTYPVSKADLEPTGKHAIKVVSRLPTGKWVHGSQASLLFAQRWKGLTPVLGRNKKGHGTSLRRHTMTSILKRVDQTVFPPSRFVLQVVSA